MSDFKNGNIINFWEDCAFFLVEYKECNIMTFKILGYYCSLLHIRNSLYENYCPAGMPHPIFCLIQKRDTVEKVWLSPTVTIMCLDFLFSHRCI